MRISAYALFFVISAGLAAQGALAKEAVVSIIHLNDVYQLSSQATGLSGLTKVPALRDRLSKNSPPLITFGGDTISPSVSSAEFKGKQMIEAWNALKPDAAVLGNHEFDFGPEVLKERIQESRFPWLAANMARRGGDGLFPGARGYVIKEVEGVRIAFVGVITEDTVKISRSGSEYVFHSAVETLCKEAARLRKENSADVVIGLTHLDMEADREAAKRCAVDMILGGHDHFLVSEIVSGKPIFKAGSDAKDAVVTHLFLDRDARKLDRIEWQIVALDKRLPDNPEIVALAQRYESALLKKLDVTIGQVATPLDVRMETVRMRESAAGFLVADAHRDAVDAEIAVVNGGSLRGDVILGPGPITRLDVMKLLPLESHVYKIELSGRQLLALFESLSPELGIVPLGRFPHVSGMKVIYHKDKPAGHRVAKVLVGGQPVELERNYSLAVSEYLAGGNDGYDLLKGAKHLLPEDAAPIVTKVVTDYIEKQTAALHYSDEGRVTIK